MSELPPGYIVNYDTPPPVGTVIVVSRRRGLTATLEHAVNHVRTRGPNAGRPITLLCWRVSDGTFGVTPLRAKGLQRRRDERYGLASLNPDKASAPPPPLVPPALNLRSVPEVGTRIALENEVTLQLLHVVHYPTGRNSSLKIVRTLLWERLGAHPPQYHLTGLRAYRLAPTKLDVGGLLAPDGIAMTWGLLGPLPCDRLGEQDRALTDGLVLSKLRRGDLFEIVPGLRLEARGMSTAPATHPHLDGDLRVHFRCPWGHPWWAYDRRTARKKRSAERKFHFGYPPGDAPINPLPLPPNSW